MSFRINKVTTIIRKEIDDVIKSRYVLSSLIGMPLVFAILLPVALLLPLILDPASMNSDELGFLQNIEFTSDWDSLDQLQRTFIALAEMSLLFFLILPIILPTVIAADSLSGEKDRGTAEGLVVTPVTDTEIYLGKIGGALLPTILSTWVFSILFMFLTNYFSYEVLNRAYFPSMNFILFVFLFGPLLGFAATNAMVWVSSRTTTSRDAQQLGSLVVIPLVLVFINAFVGIYLLPKPIIFVIIVVILIIDYLMARVGIQLLDREKWVK